MPSDSTWRFHAHQLDKNRIERAIAELSRTLGHTLLDDVAEDSDEADADDEAITYFFQFSAGPGAICFYEGDEDDGAWMSVESSRAENGACWDELQAFARQLAGKLGATAEARD